MESRKNTDGGAGHSVQPAAAGTRHTGVASGTFTAGSVPRPVDGRSRCKAAFHRPPRSSALLVYDNLRSTDAIRPWLPPHGTPCHVIMTSVLDPWDSLCPAFPVELLDGDDSLALVASIAGEDACRDDGLPLVDWPGRRRRSSGSSGRRGRSRVECAGCLDRSDREVAPTGVLLPMSAPARGRH